MSNEHEDQREALHAAGGFTKTGPKGELHRPLAEGDTFKGGLDWSRPSVVPVPVPPVSSFGWICAKCGAGNAPANATCARCTRPYS